MLKVTWRNLVARKLRLLLSAFAIVLGVAFVAGSLIFTDAMGGAFDDIIEGSTADVEVAYEGANDFDSAAGRPGHPGRRSSTTSRSCRRRRASTRPPALQSVFVIGADGKVVGGNGPPGLAFNPTETRSITGKQIIDLTDGAHARRPRRGRARRRRPPRRRATTSATRSRSSPPASRRRSRPS